MKYTFTRCIRILLLIIVAVTAFLTGKAQYVFSTLETGGNYTAVAKDRNDNIYTTRRNSTTGLYDVVKYWASNGLTTVIYSGLSNGSAVQVNNPWGIAVNSYGDVYVLNSFGTGNGQILRLYGGYATVVRSGRYFSAITVDKNDNLLAIEYNSTTSTFDIVRYQYDGDAGTRLYTGIAVPAKGFSYPWGLVTDSQGNIYFTDFLESAAHPGGAVMKLTYPGYAVSTLATGREFTALAVDASNNLYTTEVVRKGRAAVVKYTNTMGTGTILDSSLTVSGIVYPKGLAVNSMGSVYIGDGPASGNGRLFRLINPGVSSIRLNGVSPTNAGVVRFLVNLTTDVSSLPASAFTLTTTGITGASIAGISSGSNGTYVVTINTGTGDGTIRLDVNGAGVTPALSNVPFTSGEVYTIDKTSPVISLAINGGAAVTNSATVALSETATDANTPMQMRFSADSSNWSAYETFAGSKSYTLATGDGTQKVYMQVKDNAGNVSGTSAVITLDQTPPVVAFTSTPPTSTNRSTATFVFAANETVTGFTASLDGGPFTPVTSPYTLTGLSDGTHTMTIKATDIAGNTGVATPYIWSIDQTAPVIQNLTSATGTYKIGQVITLTANMSEAVITDNAGTEAPYINMTIGSTTRKAVYASGAGTNQWTFTYTVQEGDLDNDGIEILSPIQVAGNTLTDAANNVLDPSFAVTASGVNVNGIRPVATLTAPATSNATTLTVTLGFDVAVTGVDASSLSLSGIAGATVTAVTPDATTSTNTYTITITVPAGSKGTLHIALAADAATAVGQGDNTNAAAATDVDYDNTAPVITSVSVPASGYYKAGTTLSFTATFDKNITVAAGGLYLPVTIGSTVVHAGYVSGSGTKELTFSYTVVAGDNDDDGIQIGSSLTADAGVLKDSYGNEAATAINGAGATNNVFVNTVIPGVTLSSGSTIVNGVFAVTATFSDAVTGLTEGDFSVVNGTVSNLQTADHIIYTVDVTPAGEGTVKVQLPVDVVENVGGNGNTVSNELQVMVDTTAPVVTGVSVPADGYYHAGGELNFTVHFSEEVVFDVTTEHPYLNVVLQSGTVQAYYTGRSGNNGMNFRYTVQDGDGDEDGIGLTGAVELDNLSVKDKAGNSANVTLAGVPVLGGVKVNTVHPTVVLSSLVTLANGAFDATATFSEAVTGLVLSDFTVNNGVVSNLQTSDNVTYTFTVTPSLDGNVTVVLPADVAVNKGDNGNLASNTVTVVADLTAPAVTNVTVPANGYYKSGSVLNFTVTFGETVNVTGTPHIAITMGSSTVYADYTSGTGTSTLTFTYTVVNGDQDLDGIAVGTLSNGSIKDAAGNAAVLTLSAPSTAGVLVNTIAPVITQVSVPANGYYHAGQTLDFSVKFSTVVNVTGGPVLPVTIGSATVNAVYTGGSGTNTLAFSYTVQDGENDLDGIALSAITGTIQDVFGNDAVLAYSAPSTAGVYVYTVHPTVTLSSLVTLVNGAFDVTATFSEAVTGLALSDFTVNNGVVSNLQTSDNVTYTFTVMPSGDGNVTVSLPADVVVNKGDNGNSASNIVTVVADLTAPVITNVAVPANGYYKSGSALDFTVTFGEVVNVTGTPHIAITMGSSTVYADYVSGTGTSTLTFTYTVVNGDQDLDGIAVGTLSNGSIKDAAGNAAVLTLSAPSTAGVLVNTIAPVITQVSVPANGYYHAGQTLDFSVKFSTVVNVTGGPVLPVTIGSATVNAVYTGGSGTNTISFSYTVQDGENDLDGITLGAITGTIQDVFGNHAVLTYSAPSTAGVYIYTVHPTVGLSTTTTNVNAPYTVTAIFSEAVTGLTLSDFTISNGTASNLQTSDNITYTITITPSADGNVTVTLPADVAVNKGDNGNSASNTVTAVADLTAPTITNVTVPANGYYKSGSVLSFAVIFGEVVNVTGTPHIAITMGSSTVYADYTSGTGTSTLTFTYTVVNGDQDLDGIAVGTLSNGSIKDAAGNAAVLTLSAPSTAGVLVNTIAPVITQVSVPANGYYHAGQTLDFSVKFSTVVNVTGIPVLPVTIGSTIVNAAYTGGSGTNTISFSYTVQDGENDLDGITLGGIAGTIQDVFGNDAVLTYSAPSTAGVYVYTVHPTVALSSLVTLVNGAFDVTATFSEAVTGLTLSDFTISNGTASSLQTSDNITYTFTVTPSLDGNVTVVLPADVAVNKGDNGNLASNTVTVVADLTAPAVTNVIVPADGYYKSGSSLNFTVTFGEAVNVTGTPHIAITMGSNTVYADYVSGTGSSTLTFTYTVVNGDQDLDGIAVGALSGGSIKDAAGNAAVLTLSAPSTAGVLVNTIAPVITQVSVPANGYYHAGQTLDFSVKFSTVVNVTGISVLPVTIGSTIVNAAYTGGSGTNTISFSYTVQDGENDLDGIALGGITGTIQDVFGNDAVLTYSAPSTAGVYVYTVHPTVALSSLVTNVNAPYTVTAIFSEAVTGLTLSDFTINNGTASNLQTSDNITYTITITPTADGNVTVSLPADVVVNKGDNGNTSSNTVTVVADLTAPAITNVTVPANGYYKSGSSLNFTVTFGEVVNVTGTPHIAITMGSNTVYADYTSGTGSSTLTFTYTVVNGDQDLDGIAVGALSGGSIKDAAGNAAVLTLSTPSTAGVLVNTIAPVITQISVPANGYYHAGQTLDFSVKFSTVVNVTGIPVLPVTIGSTIVNAAYTGGSGTNTISFSYTVQDGENDLDGITLGAITGTIQDVFSNDAVLTYSAPSTTGVYVYTVHPTVTLSTTVANVNTPYTVTAIFSEAVTGLTLADFTINNGTASNLQTSDNVTYTFTITPSADGNVTVTLPADAAVNKGDNGNTASNTLTVFSDITPPVITNGQTFSIDEYSAAGTTVGTINAIETTGTLQNWTITNDPSGAFAINAATGVLSVKDETAVNASINTTVPLTITVSDGINVSNAATVAVTVIYVPLPPTDINLDNQIIVENTPAQTLVGHLSAVTAEPNPVYTYTLAAGTGSTDNASFTISGNQLLTNAVLDYDVKNLYTVRIRATLANGLYTEKAFTIQLGQVNQAPTLDPVANQEVCDVTTAQTIQTTGASAVETGQTLSYAVRADQAFFTSLEVNNNGLITYHLQPNVSGTVHVTVTVKDNGGTAYGGVDTLAQTFTIKVNALPTVIITADQDTVISKGTAMNLSATGGVNYEWSNAGGIIDGQQTATLQIRPVENAVYTVTVTDNNGCINTGAMTITVVNEFKVDATNLLTPNGDGKNDKWVIGDLSRYPNNDLTIYDRAGRVVYHQKNYNNEWDGTYNGSPLAEGTYYYILKADGYNTPAKGFITIIRDQH